MFNDNRQSSCTEVGQLLGKNPPRGREALPDQEKGLVCDRAKDGSTIFIEGRRWEHSEAGILVCWQEKEQIPTSAFLFLF